MDELEKAIKGLRMLVISFKQSVTGAEGEYPDGDSMEALEGNQEAISSLNLAIQALQEKAERDKT